MTAVTADLETFVQQEIASGRFPNRESVVAHALRMLQREREDATAGILAGLEDVTAGRTQPLSDAFDSLRRELKVPDQL